MSSLIDEQNERIVRNKEEALRRQRATRLEKENVEVVATPSHAQNTPIAKTSEANDIICIGTYTPTTSRRPLSNKLQEVEWLNQKPFTACATPASASSSIRTPNPPSKLPLQSSNNLVSLFKRNNQKSSLSPKTPSPSTKPVPRPPSMSKMPKQMVKLSMTLISAERVKVVFAPFHQAVVDALKTLETRHWDNQKTLWTLGLEDVKQAATILKAIKACDVKVDSVPHNIIKMLSDYHSEVVPNDLSKVIDPELVAKLFPYQNEGVKFAISRGGRAMISDEMGLGKSLQALTTARYYKSEWPLMIVCPSSVKAAWKHQINTFLPFIKKIYMVEKNTDPLPDARTSDTVVIMSYELMVLKQVELAIKKYYVIILDECHMLKDGKTKRTKAAQELAKKANRVLMLSGTPALSRPIELFSQIKIINDHLFKNYKDFATRYCDGKQTSNFFKKGTYHFEAKGCTNSEELTAVLLKRIMIRRLKADVLKDLPDKRREVVYLSGSSIDSRMDSLKRAKAAFEASNNPSMPAQHNEHLLQYYSATGIVKAAAVSEHILDNYFHADAEPRKVLIFGHHQIMLDTIQVEVHKRNLRSIRIDGSTPSKDRGPLCEQFQTDPNVVVAILSMTAAGVGITLTAASVVVFAELHWNPGTLMQAEDRAHRVGQKDSVFVQYLVARNTADDQIWPLLQTKLDILGQVKLSSDTYRDADSSIMLCDEPQCKRRRTIEGTFK